MAVASRSFQIFAKPAGSACNLGCRYCYYLSRKPPGPGCMSDELLENYIVQHLDASPDEVIRFSWHGGEPTILGVDYFQRIVELQRRHCPAGRLIANGMQTNGTLLDDQWGRLLAAGGFSVGLSLDGPRQTHDRYRVTKEGRPTFDQAIRGYEILRRHGVPTDVLCVVSSNNVRQPTKVYGFFKEIDASYVTFLPLVELQPGPAGVTSDTVGPEAWGEFLCAVFDEWVSGDIGRIKVQIIEEAARVAFGQEHSLCLFRPTCGEIPVLERNGDLYACDHFVDTEHRVGNIREAPLGDLLESASLKSFGRAKLELLPGVCRDCEVRAMCNGECPKNRFVRAPNGEPGLNYLCPGYKRFFTHVTPFVREVAVQWRKSLIHEAHGAA